MTSDRGFDDPRGAYTRADLGDGAVEEDLSPGVSRVFYLVPDPDTPADLDEHFVEGASLGAEDTYSVEDEQVRRGVRSVSADWPAGINWLAGVAAALVAYFAFQAASTGATSWGSCWLGGHEPVLLWVICLCMVPAVAVLSAATTGGRGRRWR